MAQVSPCERYGRRTMGRRILRKIKPDIDLSRHLKTFEQLPNPWNPAALFDRAAPLEIEVGSGKGLFMRTESLARPDVNFLGLEIAVNYAALAAFRLAREGRTNAVMMEGDGLRVFAELLPDDSLQAVHVYFPDPWWKKKHRKRRVMRESFLKDVQRTLMPGGKLHFWTDVEEYFHSTLDLIRETTTLQGPFDVPERAASHDLDYRTHFERRMRQHDEPIYRAEFLK